MVGALVCAGSAAACSLLLDWNSFSDGIVQPDGGSGITDAEAVDDGDSAVVSVALESCGTGKLCSPAVPGDASGWSGPFALFSGTTASLPSTCDPTLYTPAAAFHGNKGLLAPPAECSCTCGAPEGSACDPPSLTFSPANNCATACSVPAVPTTLPVDGGCVVVPPACPSFAVGSLMQTTGGSCTPDGGVVLAPLAWSTAAMACSPAGASAGSCGSGELCLPSAAPFCIMHAGSLSCPPGEYYVAQHVYYADAGDTRGCSGCSCGAPASGSCSFMVGAIFDAASPPGGVYIDTSCGTPGGVLFVPEACTLGVKSLKLIAPTAVDAGSCTPSTATPTGDASPATPTTFCCTR